MISFPSRSSPPLLAATGSSLEAALKAAPQAEWGLAHQGARVLLSRDRSSGWLVRRAGCHLVALGLPLGQPALRDLVRTGRSRGLMPLLYKCDASTALQARAAGWRVVRLGEEAILDLPWNADRPACRQLRRKLRGAVAAGVVVREETDLPLSAMAEISRVWTDRCGRERGFSMGRFDPQLLRRQRVFSAYLDGRLVAFASLHATRDEWTLDLMRHGEAAPAGTMHCILSRAAEQATEEGALRLSLAAIPNPPASSVWKRVPGLGNDGLGQFKCSFGPRLTPRYAAAPGPLSLAAGLAAVAWAIHRPGPLPTSEQAAEGRSPEGLAPASFAFERMAAACDARLASAERYDDAKRKAA